MLFRAEEVAGSADLEVAQGDAESRAELRVFPDRREALLRHLRQHLAAAVGEIGEGPGVRPAHAPADLVELGEAVVFGVFDDERVGVRDVDARLDDRGADEDVDVAADEGVPDPFDVVAVHFSVCHGDPGVGDGGGDAVRDMVDALDLVVEVEHLPAAPQLPPDGLEDQGLVVFHDVGLDRGTQARRLLEHAHVDDPAHRHV